MMRGLSKKDFGTTPDYFIQCIDRALRMEEESYMKKKVSAALVISIIVFLVVGTALAVAIGNYGVLDFLMKNNEASEYQKELIQSDFTQAGADMKDVSIRVRDAVSDGITLVLSVEAKAKESDAVLMLDTDKAELVIAAQGHDLGTPTGRERNEPDWLSFPEDQKYIYIGIPVMEKNSMGEYDSDAMYLIGTETYYESAQTIVYTLIYDITMLRNSEDMPPVRFTLATKEIAEMTSNDGDESSPSYKYPRWSHVEKATISVQGEFPVVETKTFVLHDPLLRVGNMQYTDVSFTISPYALYFEHVRSTNPEEPEVGTLVSKPAPITLEDTMVITDDLGRAYHELCYGYISTSIERSLSSKTNRVMYGGFGAPYPTELTLLGLYENGSNQVYEVTVELEEKE